MCNSFEFLFSQRFSMCSPSLDLFICHFYHLFVSPFSFSEKKDENVFALGAQNARQIAIWMGYVVSYWFEFKSKANRKQFRSLKHTRTHTHKSKHNTKTCELSTQSFGKRWKSNIVMHLQCEIVQKQTTKRTRCK